MRSLEAAIHFAPLPASLPQRSSSACMNSLCTRSSPAKYKSATSRSAAVESSFVQELCADKRKCKCVDDDDDDEIAYFSVR